MDRQTSSKEIKSKVKLGSTERERWDRHAESLLSMLGYAVGLGNIWRFPYLVMRNGGGAFLIPFAIFLLICGIPVYFLEVASGQFSGKGVVELYDVCPLLRGVGIGICLTSAMSMGYYSMILGYTIYYLANSFKSPLPWTLCEQSWNTAGCFTLQNIPVVNESLRQSLNVTGPGNQHTSTNESKATSNTSVSYISSAEEFWQENVLHMSEGIHQLGSMQWYIAFCQLAAWFIAFLCVIKGIKSSGKAVYITATLPYILLTVLLIRGLTLRGSVDGILFYITPDFTRLKDFQVWLEAAVQVFYSVGIVWGPLITLGSYNRFKNNCLRDSIILCIGGELTSVFGGLVVFAILGVMADKRGVTVDKVAKSGPGLAFIAYPEAISMLPVPNLWAVIFFLMLLAVGLDSVFGVVETVLTTFADRFQFFRSRRVFLAALVVGLMYLHNLVFCTEGGIYAFQLFDWYIAVVSVPVFGLAECVIFTWIYGTDNFSKDIKMMIGRDVPVIIRFCWCFLSPAFFMLMLIVAIIKYQPPQYGKYEFPESAEIVGWFFAILGLFPIPIWAILEYKRTEGKTFMQKIKRALRPNDKWRPNHAPERESYRVEDHQLGGDLLQIISINIIGKKD